MSIQWCPVMKHSLIVRHALIIVIIWIIIAAISAPLASRIEDVTTYNAERLLPNGTDSVKASQLLSEITGSGAGGNTTGGAGLAGGVTFDIVIVTGVNATDKGLVEWDKVLNRSIRPYVVDYSSPYHTVVVILESMNSTLLNMSKTLYNSSNKMVEMLEPLYENRSSILEYLNTTHRLLITIIDYGNRSMENISGITRRAEGIVRNITMVKELYVNLSRAYNESIKGLEEIHGLGLLIHAMLTAGDEYYAGLSREIQDAYNNITMANQSFSMLNEMYYNVSRSYTRLVYDVVRIHYYLLTNTTAYSTGLNKSIIEDVIEYTADAGEPVSPLLVNTTYGIIVSSYNPYNLSDRDVYSIASRIQSMEYTGLPYMYQQLYLYYLSIYNETMYGVGESILENHNYSSMIQVLGLGRVEGQLLLDQILSAARNASLPLSADVFAEYAAPIVTQYMGLPENATPAVRVLFRDAVLPGYPPDPCIYEDVFVNDTVYMFSLITGTEPLNATYEYIRGLYEQGPVIDAARRSLYVFLGEVFPAPASIVNITYDAITGIDPYGNGLIAVNDSLANQTVAGILSNITGLPVEAAYTVYMNESSIPYVAYTLLRQGIINMTGSSEFAAAADVIYEYHGRICLEGFTELFTKLGASVFSSYLPGNISGEEAESILKKIAVMAWNDELTPEFFTRLILASGLAREVYSILGSTSTGLPSNVSVAGMLPILLNLPIIDSIINGSYPDNPVGYTVDSIIVLINITGGGSTGPMNFSMLDPKLLLYKLIDLPENPDKEELAKTLADVLVEVMRKKISTGSTGEYAFNTSLVEPILVDILAHDTNPIDAVANHLGDLIPPEYRDRFNTDKLSAALRRSLEAGSPGPIYDEVYSEVFDDIFVNVTSSMRGLMISPDNSSFVVLFKPKSDPSKYDNSLKVRDVVAGTLEEMGYRPGYIGVTGDDVLEHEAKTANSRDIENVNRISILAPIIIALILIGGFVAAGLPFIGIGLSVLLSTAILYILGYTGIINVTSWARMLMITTSFGLGMDYSSYIVLRFKEKIAEYRDPRAAAHDALTHSLPAIAAASSTDIIGFAVMMLAWDFPLLSSIGQMVPIAVLSVLAASLTFTPAALTLWGDRRWFWWPHRPETGRGRWRGFSINRSRAIGLIMISLVLGGIGAYGLLSFKGSHDYSVFMPEGTEGYKAYAKLQEVFPVGQLLPIYIVGRISNGTVWDHNVMDQIKSISKDVESINGVVEVYGPHNPGNRPRTIYVGRDNKTFYLEVIIKPSPMSREGIELTKTIRSIVYNHRGGVFSEIYVGGLAASSLEMEELLNRDFWYKIFPVGIVLMWLAMTLSFMSIWAGIISLSTIVIGYMIGVTLASQIPGMYGQPALWFIPLMTFPAVLGVGMDYNSFYMNRQREEFGKNLGKKDAGYISATAALRAVSHLVIGLGLIVTSTYSALVIGSSWGVRELGLALAGGVFTTTLLASIFFTPPLLAIMGRRAWWPYNRRWKK